MGKQDRHYFDRPAVYQIRLQGRLPANWSDSVAAMAIEVTGDMTDGGRRKAGDRTAR